MRNGNAIRKVCCKAREVVRARYRVPRRRRRLKLVKEPGERASARCKLPCTVNAVRAYKLHNVMEPRGGDEKMMLEAHNVECGRGKMALFARSRGSSNVVRSARDLFKSKQMSQKHGPWLRLPEWLSAIDIDWGKPTG